MSFGIRLFVVGVLAVGLVGSGFGVVAQTICIKNHLPSGCVSKTALQTAVNPPPVLCTVGTPIIQIDSKASCGGGSTAGPARFFRCAIVNTPIVYSGGGFTHKLAPTVGNNWGTVSGGNCNALAYKAG